MGFLVEGVHPFSRMWSFQYDVILFAHAIVVRGTRSAVGASNDYEAHFVGDWQPLEKKPPPWGENSERASSIDIRTEICGMNSTLKR